MRKIYLTILFALTCIIQLKAQGFEVSVQANGGESRFTGKGTLSATNLNAGSASDHTGYPNGTGNSFAFSFGAGFQAQYVFASNFMVGSQFGFEQLNSKAIINGVYDGSTLNSGETPATGFTIDHLNYFNFSPFIGYRFSLGKVRLDLMPGFDIACGLGGSETVNVKAGDGTYYNKPINNYGGSPRTDVSFRFGVAAWYGKFGVNASYSHGITDFNSGALADAVLPGLTTELLRLGVAYRLK